jgi:para-nitrobenzyl esterase
MIFALYIALGAIWMSAASDPTVAVTGGQIRGVSLSKGGAVFKGIPFARPPVGDLRWREPQPVTPWAGVRDATKFGPICAQKPTFMAPNAAEVASEDCLYLNVWTADWPSTSRKAVMVWIPGGGNFAGGGTDAVFDGESLARHGVVLVTINYRLGSFGFYSHPALTRESSHRASGNQGIQDQIAALIWVRDNIAAFGGDPANVTIFGESAGSLDVSVLMTSPLSKGLFRRVIGESGAVILAGEPSSLSGAEGLGQALAARLKVSPTAAAADLRAFSARDIWTAEPDRVGGGVREALISFPNLGITVDGYVFPKKPAEVFAKGDEHRVDLLLGNNAREGGPAESPSDLAGAISSMYGPLAERVKKLYVGAPDPSYGTAADQWATDTTFRCSAVQQLIWHAAAGNTAYEFEFARIPPGRESVGATHASELSHVFGTTAAVGVLGVGPPVRGNDIDAQLSETMQQYWTNFAKTGNPNGGQLPKWPKFNPSMREYIQFTDAGPVAKQGLRRPYCDVFIENVKRLTAK